MVRQIAEQNGKKMRFTHLFNLAIRLSPMNITKKVFGNLTYEIVDTVGKYDFKKSIEETEQGINTCFIVHQKIKISHK